MKLQQEYCPWSIYLSRKPPNAGVSPPAVFRFCAARGASPVLSALARSGGFQRTQRSQRTRGSRTGSISRNLPKTKNEPHHVSTENILPDKQGVASFGTTDSSERVTYFQAEDVLASNIRPYFKKMWFATTSGGCNADVLCFRALDKKYAYLLKSIMFQDGFFDYVMSGAKGTEMPRGDKTHIMLYPIPRFSETQLLKFIEYNKISFGEGGRMRSLSRVSRKQRYSTLDFPAENRVPTGMQNSPESIKAFAVFDVTFNIYS